MTQPPVNKAKQMLQADQLVLCMAVNQMRTAEAPVIAAACGFDAIFIDLEHSATSTETAAMIAVSALGAGITPIARVSSHQPFQAARIPRCRRAGVRVPHIENAREAQAIVDSLRFPPLGRRSAYGTGPALRYAAMGQGEVNAFLNEHELLIAMLEVAKACKAHGKAMGVGGARSDFELQKDLIQLGVRYLTAGSDVSYLMTAARSEVNSLRGIAVSRSER